MREHRAMTDTSTTNPTTPPTRRGLLKLFGAAAAGGVVAMAVSDRADAANGDSIVMGVATNSASSGTGLEVANAGRVAYGFGVTDNGLGAVAASYGNAAVFGHAKSKSFVYGVSGYTEGVSLIELTAGVRGFADGHGLGVLAGSSGTGGIALGSKADGDGGTAVFAIGAGNGTAGVVSQASGIGVIASGLQGGVSIQQYTTPLAPPPDRTGVEFPSNCLDVDASHNLWWSISQGPNAQWRKVSGPGTGGAFHPLAPTRVFDSRVAAPHRGQLAGGHSVTVSVKDGRNSTTGAVNHANLVPAKATAIACNVTVTNTVGAGHLSVNPGGATGATTFTVSWSASGQTHTSGTIAKINPATLQVTLAVAGLTKADVIVDITGYWR
jgi:hypothetical protein